jgi:hypothetical protein
MDFNGKCPIVPTILQEYPIYQHIKEINIWILHHFTIKDDETLGTSII